MIPTILIESRRPTLRFELPDIPALPSADAEGSATNCGPVQTFLKEQDWLESGESISRVERAGEGNMNRTLRVRSDRRSFILKQSFPYCAKFPEIPAPIHRIEVEVAFYGVARRSSRLASHMPSILAFAPDHHLAMIEDLGTGSDLLSLYAGVPLAEGELGLLGELVAELHSLTIKPDEAELLKNTEMRILNEEHIFDIPLRENNGLDLDSITPGLTDLAAETQRDQAFVRTVRELGKLYLNAEGPVLLHGDYYPGSFLRTDRGLSIIDPEFAFMGPAEFDLSVLVAHLIFAGGEPRTTAEQVVNAYGRPVEQALVRAFAGAELMRRTLGVSQLPLQVSLETKQQWLECSRSWVKAL